MCQNYVSDKPKVPESTSIEEDTDWISLRFNLFYQDFKVSLFSLESRDFFSNKISRILQVLNILCWQDCDSNISNRYGQTCLVCLWTIRSQYFWKSNIKNELTREGNFLSRGASVKWTKRFKHVKCPWWSMPRHFQSTSNEESVTSQKRKI